MDTYIIVLTLISAAAWIIALMVAFDAHREFEKRLYAERRVELYKNAYEELIKERK